MITVLGNFCHNLHLVFIHFWIFAEYVHFKDMRNIFVLNKMCVHANTIVVCLYIHIYINLYYSETYETIKCLWYGKSAMLFVQFVHFYFDECVHKKLAEVDLMYFRSKRQKWQNEVTVFLSQHLGNYVHYWLIGGCNISLWIFCCMHSLKIVVFCSSCVLHALNRVSHQRCSVTMLLTTELLGLLFIFLY